MRIQICGPLAADYDDQRLHPGLPGQQGRLLFTYLVVNRYRQIPATNWPKPFGGYPTRGWIETILCADLNDRGPVVGELLVIAIVPIIVIRLGRRIVERLTVGAGK